MAAPAPQNALYRLESMADNPAYEGFISTEQASETPAALKFHTMQQLDNKVFKPRRLLPSWRPVKVTGRVRKTNDFPAVGNVPVFSERAVDALRDLLEPAGELIPLETPLGNYFAYNPLITADVLDPGRAKIEWLVKPILISSIEDYQVVPEKLDGLSIFVLPYDPGHVMVTEAFAERAHQHGLRGMHFVRVWPLPPGVVWWEMRKHDWRAIDREGLPEGKTAKGNTVVIRLPLADPKATAPAPDEEKRIAQIESDLDVMLVNVNSTAPAVGSREGRDEVVGEARVFITCPDAAALVEHIRRLLKRLRWPGGFRVLKRYGEFVDPDAREQYVDRV
jgi:hypothetical protein